MAKKLILRSFGFSMGTPLLLLAISSLAQAGGPQQQPRFDSASAEALQKTMSLLESESGRQDALSKNPDARAIDAQVKTLGGNPQNADAIYQLSAEVMSQLVQQTGGDVTKMQAIVQQAKDNPKAFYDRYFTTEDKVKLEQIASKISSAPAAAPTGASSSKNH